MFLIMSDSDGSLAICVAATCALFAFALQRFQGAFGALLIPQGIAIMTSTFPPNVEYPTTTVSTGVGSSLMTPARSAIPVLVEPPLAGGGSSQVSWLDKEKPR